jgi:hypothetical protein
MAKLENSARARASQNVLPSTVRRSRIDRPAFSKVGQGSNLSFDVCRNSWHFLQFADFFQSMHPVVFRGFLERTDQEPSFSRELHGFFGNNCSRFRLYDQAFFPLRSPFCPKNDFTAFIRDHSETPSVAAASCRFCPTYGRMPQLRKIRAKSFL